MSEEFFSYISADNMDIKEVNRQIADIHNIFLTNNLPETIKLFEFFKYHPNYNRSNDELYKDTPQEERDKIILGDLFVTSLNSDNRQLGNFLELIHNGDLLYDKKRNGYELEEFEEAILYSYSEALTSLYSLMNKEKIDKTADISLNIENIREKLKIDKNAGVGDSLLLQYLEGIGLNVEKYGKQETTCETLLDYMKQQRKKTIERNSQDINISEILQERRFN